MEMVQRIRPERVVIYAMGREPWLGHVMVLAYDENAPQMIESRALIAQCHERGIIAEMPFGFSEFVL